MTKETIEYYSSGTLINIGFVSVYAKHQGRWVFCLHKYRQTWECPGGHVEAGESALEAAKRELYEETGAKNFSITPLWDYSFISETHSNNGTVFFADIESFDDLPSNEMDKIGFFDDLPENLTYDREKVRDNLERVEKYITYIGSKS